MPRLSQIPGTLLVVLGLVILIIVFLWTTPGAAAPYQLVNLVSDDTSVIPAANVDANLVDPRGISSSATSPFWVSNHGTGVATQYNGSGTPQPLVVSIPPPSGGTSNPTGVVFNGGTSFALTPNNPARFLFAAENGTISGWNGGTGTSAAIVADNSASASYTGLALGNNGTGDFLYAANFSGGHIDVFNSTFALTTLSGGFTDPNLPPGTLPSISRIWAATSMSPLRMGQAALWTSST
jgi:uncharacterized protein (TIGR03118 family)